MPIFGPDDIARYASSVTDAPHERITKPTPIGPWPYAAVAGGNALDLASSLYGMRHGTREANPAIGNDSINVVMAKLAAIAAEEYAVKQLASSGHGRAAKILGYALGAEPAIVAAHNFSIAK